MNARILGVLVFAVMSLSCGELGVPGDGADEGSLIAPSFAAVAPASLVLTPSVDTLTALTETTRLIATAFTSSGAQLAEVGVIWKSLNTGIATVSTNGTVTAKAPGTARIIAKTKCCAVADTTKILVKQVPVTVDVTPSALLLAPGTKGTLSAVVRDALGSAIANASITWSSSASTVANVSSSGVVSALKVGTATITARSAERSGSSTVTVGSAAPPPTSPPPPAPPPPTQSTGLLFSDNFDAGRKTNVNGYNWALTPLNVTVSNDIAYNGSYSLKFRFPGKASLCDDATAEQRLALGEQLREAWFEYYVYIPDGTEGLGAKFQHRLPTCAAKNDANGTVSNNKFFAIWDTNYTSKDVGVIFEYRRMTSGTAGDSYLYGMYDTDTQAAGRYGSGAWQPAIYSGTRGRWNQIRIHVKVATSKAAQDGGYELWANGQLVISEMDLALAPAAGGNAFFRNMYLMGWANSGFDQDTNVYIDSFKIYGSDPGW